MNPAMQQGPTFGIMSNPVRFQACQDWDALEIADVMESVSFLIPRLPALRGICAAAEPLKEPYEPGTHS